MRKLFLSLALMACSLTYAATTVLIDGLYYSLGTSSATVLADQSSGKTVYSAYTSVTIPTSVTYEATTYPITTIGTSAFEAMTNLESVVLPTSITTFNTDAFYGCTKLSHVNLHEGIETIGTRAFYNCKLTEVTIPSTVTTIGNGAFKGNPLTTITWLPADCSIGTDTDAPFYSTSSKVTSFTFGENVEVVPAFLCKNMSQLDTVVLPPSVRALGQNAFQYCTSLKYINLPVTQKTLPISFLEGCTSLDSIHLPATLTTISTDVFYGCSNLSKVNIDEGLETIGTRAFYNCKLTEVTIPSTVTTIGNGAFKGNPLTTITWLPADCSIGTDTDAPFYSTSSKVTSFTFGENVEVVPAFLCKNMSQLDTVVLPPSVRALGQNAFQYCTSLKYINLPVTQKTLPISFLEGCTSLDSIHLPATLTTISTDVFYGCSNLSKVNIDEGLETIGTRAFYNCKLTEVTIPSTVTTIGNGAFKGNPLTTITWLPAECSTGSDSDAPFYSTSSQVTSFTFGENVVTVPWYICKNMSKLDTVVLPPSVKSLGSNAFQYCTSLKYINLPVTQKTLPISFLEGCTALDSIHLPATLTTISTDVFYGCSKLSKVNLDEGLVTIGTRAFNGCNLKDITIPSTVTSIGNGAFKGNPTVSITWLPAECSIGSDSDAPFYSTSSQVTSFTFGDSVKVVPPYLCKNMSKVETIVLPPAVTSVGRNAFMYCTALQSLEFPEGITIVATSILEGCTGLKSVIIPASVASIYQDAFYGCKGLQAIYNHATTPQSITERVMYNVDKTTCALYVPAASFDLYADAPVWKDFLRKEIPTVYYEFSEAACDSFIWNDKTYKQSQDIIETFKIWKEEQRTDSIVTLHLTINHSNAGEEYRTAEGSFVWHGETLTESGNYQITLTNAAGCDSVATLHLTITLPPVYYEFSETACDAYTWNNKTYTTSQDVVETFIGAAGQDSIVTLHLTINHSTTGEEYQTAEGSYIWHDHTYTESGNYPITLTNAVGCDSVATLHLTIIPLWKVTVQQPLNGAISIQETGIDLTKVVDGTLLHFIATPDEGYLFEAWSGCDEDGSLLVKANATVTCTFVLEPVTAIDPLHDGTPATKILRDGQLFILRGDKTYTATGKEVQ